MQTFVIFNPSARGEKAEAFCESLQDFFPRCISRRTTRAGEARDLAAEAVRNGFDTIIAAGGDGTANEVVNGIADVPGGLDSTQMGVLPLGTLNLFARELGLPRNPARAAAILKLGKTKMIDLGVVEYGVNGSAQKRFFVQLAGAGIDSRAIELVDWEQKKRFGPLAYIIAGLKAMAETKPVIFGSGLNGISGELVLIGNGRCYGGLPVFPKASLEDGLLDICVLPKVSWQHLMGAAPKLLTGLLKGLSSARSYSATSVTLSSKSRVSLQLDGDNACELPATLSIRPKALRVIVP